MNRRIILIAISGASILMILVSLRFTHVVNKVEPHFTTLDALQNQKFNQYNTETVLLNIPNEFYFATYNPTEGSIYYSHITQSDVGYQVKQRTEKVGFPVGEANVTPAQIIAELSWDASKIKYQLLRNDVPVGEYGVDDYQEHAFSNATLYYTVP